MTNKFRAAFKHKTLFCAFLIYKVLSPHTTTAQLSNFTIDNVATPSPNAISLGKYGNFPANNFTGVPSVSIPLYTAKVGQFKLPISLSYSSTGVKVEEKGGNVGISWSLNAGGIITRAVRSVPDDYNYNDPEGFGLNHDPMYTGLLQDIQDAKNAIGGAVTIHLANGQGYQWTGTAFSADTIWTPMEPTYEKGQPGYFICNNAPVANLVTYGSPEHIFYDLGCGDDALKGFDFEPDVFYLNFNGITGQFVIDGSQKVRIIPFQQDLSITPFYNNIGEITSFKVIDKDGISYLFDQIERKVITFAGPIEDPGFWGGIPFNASWYLSKMTLPNSDEIDFSYQDYSMVESRRTMNAFCGAAYDPLDPEFNPADSSKSFTKSKILSQIDTKNEKITFKSSLRDDVIGDYKIDSLIIDSKNSYQPVEKKVRLNYTYVTPVNETAPSPYYSQYYQRLFLNKIVGTDSGIYSFDYNNASILPNKQSMQQDLWGYFTHNYAATAIPEVYAYPDLPLPQRLQYEPLPNYTGTTIHLAGVNRTANPNTVTYGMLSKITYPTGGTTTFNFESGEYYDPLVGYNFKGGGVRIKSTIAYDGIDHTKDQSIEYTYSDPDNPTQSAGRIIYKPVLAYPAVIGYYASDFASGADITQAYKDNIVRTTNSANELGTTSGSYIGYKDVTVTQNQKNKTVYTYSFPLEYGKATDGFIVQMSAPTSIYSFLTSATSAIVSSGFINSGSNPYSYPFPPEDLSNGIFRGKLLSKTMYDDITNNVVYNETYTWGNYSNYASPLSYVKGVKIDGVFYEGNVNTIGNQTILSMGTYYIRPNMMTRLVGKATTTYDPSGNAIQTNETYTYLTPQQNLSPVHPYMTSETTTNSSGENLTTYYKYVQDFSNLPNSLSNEAAGILNLQNKHVFSPAIEKYTTLTNSGGLKAVSGEIMTYRSDKTVPYAYYKTESNVPITTFTPSSVNATTGQFIKDPSYALKTTADSYDNSNNLSELQSSDAPDVVYLWGYNNQYLVAKIVGSTKAAIDNIINQTVLDNPTSDQSLRDYLNTIRTSLPSTLVTTYTYKPLIGMTSKTDASQSTEFYEYDTFGRLIKIKDSNGNIIKSVSYQVQAPQ